MLNSELFKKLMALSPRTSTAVKRRLRDYLVRGVVSSQVGKDLTKQAMHSRLRYHLQKGVAAKLFDQKDFK